MPSLITVANRLPVTISGSKIKKSAGGLVAAMEGLSGDMDLSWVGWPGAAAENQEEESNIRKQLNEDYGFEPVFLSDEHIDGFYHGFSNQSLWPLLHYMSLNMEYQEEWWTCYKEVNQAFADRTLSLAKDGDVIWVHDYQLMLVPTMIRQANPSLKIGFFLHTPFPSYELFRCHPKRNQLLEGLLGADYLGFHTFGYLRHFRSTVLRCLGVDSEIDRVPFDGRQIGLGVHPIGINAAKFVAQLESEAFKETVAQYRESYAGKRIVLSVERLDYTKGILHRLWAIERYLASGDAPENVMFLFIAVPSRGEVEEYQRLRERVEGLVGRINGEYATVENIPVHFIHGTVSFPELCALYSLADVCAVTPLIDGMNLVAKEFVACQEEGNGVLLLSEFAGAANELNHAVLVNPYAAEEIAKAIKEAIAMPLAERRERMAPMRERVLKIDANFWAQSFLDRLNYHSTRVEPTVGGLLPQATLTESVRSAKRMAVVLDYDGTLREFVKNPNDAGPTQAITELLERLQATPNADVYVVSGRREVDLQRWLGHYPFTLVGEHGYRGRPNGETTWSVLTEEADLSWRDQVLRVFRYFESQTPGSSIEEKRSAVVWHYRRSDPEFGSWKANQMVGELYETLSNLPVEIHHGKKIVEVSSVVVTKGNAVRQLTHEKDYDLVLIAGDDQTDESMFQAEVSNMLSIKIGEGDTSARYRVESPATFRKMMMAAFAAEETNNSEG